MNGTRRRRPAKQNQVTMFTALRRLPRQFFTTHVGWYVPAVTPILLFLFAHLLTLITFILIRTEVIHLTEPVYANMVTWSVYGLIPLILSSYGCFFLVARPLMPLINHRLGQWSASGLHGLNSCLYGWAIGVTLLVLLQPGVGGKALLLFFVGLASGIGNWQLYRRLAAVPPLTPQHPARPENAGSGEKLNS